MYRHRPNCLPGPVSRTSSWWTLAQLEDPLFRQELVDRVRREIASGIYDTPEKWEAALERLGQRLESE